MPDMKWLVAGAAGLFLLTRRKSEVQAGTVNVEETEEGTFHITPEVDPESLPEFDLPIQRVTLTIDGNRVFHAVRGEGVTTEFEYEFQRGEVVTIRLEVEDDSRTVFVFEDTVLIPE